MTSRVALAIALLLRAGPATAGEWVVDGAGSRLVVHAFRAGLLRAFAHDHHFVPERWHGSASVDAARLREVRGAIVVDAASLRDTQEALSAGDRAKVDRQVAAEVLRAARFPEIRFEVEGFEEDGKPEEPGRMVRGSLRGRMSLQGVERPLAAPVEIERAADRITVRGRAVLSRRDFGVKVPSVALGAVSVKDRVEIEFALILVPARAGNAPAP